MSSTSTQTRSCLCNVCTYGIFKETAMGCEILDGMSMIDCNIKWESDCSHESVNKFKVLKLIFDVGNPIQTIIVESSPSMTLRDCTVNYINIMNFNYSDIIFLHT